MNILIIGNGFDVAHELPTRYTDFLGFINDIKTRDDLMTRQEQIKEILELVNNNIWIIHFNKIKNATNNKWVDFEDEILQVISRLNPLITFTRKKGIEEYRIDMDREKPNNINDNYKYITQFTINNNIPIEKNWSHSQYFSYFNNLLSLKDKLLCDLNNLVRCLELYLVSWVGMKNVEISLDDIPKSFLFDGVLSFNYTSTFEKYYSSKNIVYIHGKAQADEYKTNMILGIDEYLQGNDKDNDVECIEFKKYFQRILKKTGNEYKSWIKGMEGRRNRIFIFGHSLGFSDKGVLEEFFFLKDTIITIFYHDEKANKEYIANLVRIIGQDEVIKRVYGDDPTIKFVEQNNELPVKMLVKDIEEGRLPALV